MKTKTVSSIIMLAVLSSLLGCNYYVDKKKNNQLNRNQDLKLKPLSFDVLKSEVLEPKCLSCHNGSQPIINLTTYSGVMRTVISGSPEQSRLFLVLFLGEDQMPKPPEQPVSDEQREYVRQWIEFGAPLDPIVITTTTTTSSTTTTLDSPTTTSTTLDSTTTTTTTTTSSTTSTTLSGPLQPTFTNVQALVFSAKIDGIMRCNGCHNPTRLKGDVDLTSYDAIKNNNVVTNLIVPGFPEKSLIYMAIEADEMPPKPPTLELDQKQLIYDWIKAGAQND